MGQWTAVTGLDGEEAEGWLVTALGDLPETGLVISAAPGQWIVRTTDADGDHYRVEDDMSEAELSAVVAELEATVAEIEAAVEADTP